MVGSPIVIIVEWGRGNTAHIRGADGTNVGMLTGTTRIPQLRRQERPLVDFLNLRSERWFSEHALHAVNPYARALIAADIEIPGAATEAALVVFDPSSQAVRDQSTFAVLSELASIAGFLLDAASASALARDEHLKERSQMQLVEHDGFADPASMTRSENPSMAEPLTFFLRNTLTKRRALRSRNSIHYVALRQWKEAVKGTQIAALRAIKTRPTTEAVNAIAEEIANVCREMYQGMQFSCVVPVPCGSSGKPECLSTLLGRRTAELLSVPFRAALEGEYTPGASHPHKSAKMKHYALVEAVSGNVLLVDDVATTGTHITLAVAALRSGGASAFPMVWIGG